MLLSPAADQHHAPLRPVAYRAQPYGGERERAEQRHSSTRLIASSAPRGKAAYARCLAGQSFATPSTAHAPAATAAPANDKIRGKISRDRTRADAYAGRRLAVKKRGRDFRNRIFFSGVGTVTYSQRPRKGFRYRPRALRRTVLQILGQRDRLTAQELAGIAFTAGRPVIRPGWRLPTDSELASTRRALRCLMASGKVRQRGRVRRGSRQRSRNVYTLTKRN
jgi:hypothetical protein